MVENPRRVFILGDRLSGQFCPYRAILNNIKSPFRGKVGHFVCNRVSVDICFVMFFVMKAMLRNIVSYIAIVSKGLRYEVMM